MCIMFRYKDKILVTCVWLIYTYIHTYMQIYIYTQLIYITYTALVRMLIEKGRRG